MSDFSSSDFAAKVAVDSLDRAVNLFTSSIATAKQKLSVAMGAGFKRYRENSRDRYGYVKTLLHRDKPIPLRELYVETFYCNDDETFSDETILGKIVSPCRILIQGTAGGGKSIFLRYVNLVVCSSEEEILPLFFEMKNLNTDVTKSLVSSLSASLATYLKDIDEAAFLQLVDDGRIILILDGFDEINFDHREGYIRQLAELSRNHPNARIVASSRPDDSIESIEHFHTYRVVPFKKEQALALLHRLPYDKTVKSKFIEAVDKELYEKHKEFLSNPLLITMMLMTYQQFAEVPNKVHIFYHQAFFTLFSLHDSSKEVYKRKSYTNLPIDEFQRVFACFCAMTYSRQAFTFSEVSVRESLKSAIAAEMIPTQVDDFLRDLLESTCLLQKDGLDIVFAHRSFQEYFTAWYIVRMESRPAKKAIDSVVKRIEADLVLPMAFEMNPALVERAWVLPTIDAVYAKFTDVERQGNPFVTLSLFFGTMFLMEDGSPWLTYAVPHLWANRLRALHKLYDRSFPSLDKEKTKKGITAFCARIRLDEEFRHSKTGLTTTSLRRILGGSEAHSHFNLGSMDASLNEYFHVDPWVRAIGEWLPNIREIVAERVAERDASMQMMFGQKASRAR